jgi:predicted small metal-binding protein
MNPGCTFEARGNSENEVLQKAAEHARSKHNITEISPEFQNKARKAIYDEAARSHSAGR